MLSGPGRAAVRRLAGGLPRLSTKHIEQLPRVALSSHSFINANAVRRVTWRLYGSAASKPSTAKVASSKTAPKAKATTKTATKTAGGKAKPKTAAKSKAKPGPKPKAKAKAAKKVLTEAQKTKLAEKKSKDAITELKAKALLTEPKKLPELSRNLFTADLKSRYPAEGTSQERFTEFSKVVNSAFKDLSPSEIEVCNGVLCLLATLANSETAL